MHNQSQTISEYIARQFPSIYREEGEDFIAFVKAYFEFLEKDNDSATKLTRGMFQNRDIDETLDRYLKQFSNQFLNNFRFRTAVDKRFIIKHIMDYYRSKGTPLSAKLLLKLIFNQEAQVYYPADDLFKLSDSKWNIPKYLELSRSSRTKGFVGKQVTGSQSGAKAFVESFSTKRIRGRPIDIIYISNLKGQFVTGETITDDNNLVGAPVMIGSLTSLTITNGGQNNTVGDVFNVIDDTGKQGLARVVSTTDATGRVNFTLVNGGSGYTLNTPDDANTTNDYTDVRVSTAMLFVDNSNTNNQFVQFETVQQVRETLALLSATDVNTNSGSITALDRLIGVLTYTEQYNSGTHNGQTIFARSSNLADSVLVTVDNVVQTSGYTVPNSTHIEFSVAPADDTVVKVVNYTETANSYVVTIANTDSDGVTTDASANSNVTVVINTGTFGPQQLIDLATNVVYQVDEVVQEEQEVTLTVNDTTGFSVSEVIEMKILSDASPVGGTQLITDYAFGTIIDIANSTTLSCNLSWGTFRAGEDIVGLTTSTSAEIATSGVSVTVAGASGTVSSLQDANTILVEVLAGEFTTGKKIRGVTTQSVREMSAVSSTGATEVWYNGVPTANGIIDTVANSTISAIVVGQNTTCVGLYGNTSAYSYIEDGNIPIRTVRELDRLLNLNIVDRPNLILTLNDTATGDSATFQPGSLENEESVSLNTDFIGANNAANISFLDTIVGTAGNSGVGFIDSITIDSGGTGYSNGGQITFTAGGFAGGDPQTFANATITTDGSGTITIITVDTPGEGYYETPTAVLPATGGSVASVTVNMDFGYGFSRNPNGDADTAFSDLFTYDTFTMGTITSLTRINPGANYNADPFVSVHNRYIASYARKDIVLDITITSGSFRVGETIYQDAIAKGIVKTASLTRLTLTRSSFNTSFNTSSPISGSSSNATATVTLVASDPGSLAMGENAIVTGIVQVANGVASSLEVVDSGYGYLNGAQMTLERTGSSFAMTATAVTEHEGVGSGYWTTKNSQLSHDKKIHDNRYYQDYSYDVQIGVALDRYRNLVKDILHVSGTELFGSFVKISDINSNITYANTSIATVSTSVS